MNVKERLEGLSNGEILSLKYETGEDYPKYRCALVKMKKDNKCLLYHDEDDKDWLSVDNDWHIGYALLCGGYPCEICKYPDDYTTAINALYTKNAVITSDVAVFTEIEGLHTYHLIGFDGTIVNAENKPANIPKREYLGKWHIEYPKKKE